MTDTVSIRDLRVSAVIGVHDWEREIEQTLVFGVDMAADVAAAAARDDIADALDYSAVAQTIRTVVTDGKFQLIETAAERVAERLLADYRLGWVRVEVAKPLPARGIHRRGRHRARQPLGPLLCRTALLVACASCGSACSSPA